MTQDQRPPDWDWVKATGTCTAQVMFGRLRELAQQNVKERNRQLGNGRFAVKDVHGLEFSVGRDGDWNHTVFFQIPDEKMTQIVVCGPNRSNETVYTVGLDINGTCRFRRGDEELDLWQVLKAALEPILFR